MSSRSRSTDRASGVPDARARAERLRLFGVDDATRVALRAVRPTLERHAEDVVTRFYEHLLAFPDIAAVLEAEPGRLERLRALQRDFLVSIADTRFDAADFTRRRQVGETHQRLGISPAWYLSACAMLLRLGMRAVAEDTPEGKLLPRLEALVQRIFYDVSLAMETYIGGGYVKREAANELERAVRVAERALAERAHLQRVRDELTSMIVHDLKNPVNGIAMMVSLALRKSADLPETQQGHLRQIERTCSEMLRLIENLLEISKIEEGRMPVASAPVDLADVVEEVAREYLPVAEESGRALHVRLAPSLAPALGDRMLVKRVLVNLVVNALRHSGSPVVRLETAPGPEPGQVSLRVVDRGTGVPTYQREAIFEKFRSMPRTPSEEPRSDTGLGLPFCKLAVERMAGRITVESADETVFLVTLPAAAG